MLLLYLLIDIEPNSVPFGSKSIGKWLIQSNSNWYNMNQKIFFCVRYTCTVCTNMCTNVIQVCFFACYILCRRMALNNNHWHPLNLHHVLSSNYLVIVIPVILTNIDSLLKKLIINVNRKDMWICICPKGSWRL